MIYIEWVTFSLRYMNQVCNNQCWSVFSHVTSDFNQQYWLGIALSWIFIYYLMSTIDKWLSSVNISWWISENKCYTIEKMHQINDLWARMAIFILTGNLLKTKIVLLQILWLQLYHFLKHVRLCDLCWTKLPKSQRSSHNLKKNKIGWKWHSLATWKQGGLGIFLT